jgi:hypothetical protein
VKIKIMALPAAAAGGLIILIMATISFCQAADYGFEASAANQLPLELCAHHL